MRLGAVEECKGLSRQLSEKNKKLEKLSLVLASMERALVTSGSSASLLPLLPRTQSAATHASVRLKSVTGAQNARA